MTDGIILGALAGLVGALIGMSLPAPRFGRATPPTPKQRREGLTGIAVILVTFGLAFFVHPLFLLIVVVWVAIENYRERGSIFAKTYRWLPGRK